MIAWWRKRRAAQQARERREPVEQMLRRLDFTVLRPIALRLGGDLQSKVRGSGFDLAEIREYQPGDDVRHLDWSATARTGVPHVRQTYADRALDVWLLVDVSPSIDWGTARRTKRSHAQELVAAISQVVSRHNNRVGAILFAERPLDVLPPAIGRPHLFRLLAKLRETPRRTVGGRTNLAAALDLARSAIRRPSVVVVVSDLLVADGWAEALGKLTTRHEVVVLRIVDPRESELPDVGIITLEDPETGEQLVVDTTDARLRARFAEAARAQAERIDRLLVTRGVRRVVASTAADLLPPLLELLDRRRVVAAQRGAFRQRRPA
ncbi:MAG TPA: DUF58 domain-containing protein [Chloroflexota bacterium]|nr:DUF58 domain-containing protein [Chloroflexota bacterium]